MVEAEINLEKFRRDVQVKVMQSLGYLPENFQNLSTADRNDKFYEWFKDNKAAEFSKIFGQLIKDDTNLEEKSVDLISFEIAREMGAPTEH